MVSGQWGKSHIRSDAARQQYNLRVTQLIGLSEFCPMLVAWESGIPPHHNFFILPSVKMTK